MVRAGQASVQELKSEERECLGEKESNGEGGSKRRRNKQKTIILEGGKKRREDRKDLQKLRPGK